METTGVVAFRPVGVNIGLTLLNSGVNYNVSMGTTAKQHPPPRSLQEWMERTGLNSARLLELVKLETGHTISPTMMSFILRGSRRCSQVNANALSLVTGVPIKALKQWPKVSGYTQLYGRRSKRVA